MKQKQYHRYMINFTGKWANTAVICMGISFFLLAVHYFGLRSLDSVRFAECLFSLILPMLCCIGFVVLIRILRFNAPGIYAILGCMLCLSLMIGTFSSGSILRLVLACIWYPLSAFVLIICAGGFLPGRLPATMMLFIALVVRILSFSLHLRGAAAWISEIAVLSMILALCCLPMTFCSGKKRI